MKSNKEKSCTWSDITQAKANQFKRNSANLDLVMLVDNMLNVTKECAFAEEKANNLLGVLGRATLEVKENYPLYSKLVRLIWSAGSILCFLISDRHMGTNTVKGSKSAQGTKTE